MRGKGNYLHADDDVYEGDYKDNKKHRKGEFLHESGNVIEGGWKVDKKHGKWKTSYANGNVYEGNNKNNKKEVTIICSILCKETWEKKYKDVIGFKHTETNTK